MVVFKQAAMDITVVVAVGLVIVSSLPEQVEVVLLRDIPVVLPYHKKRERQSATLAIFPA